MISCSLSKMAEVRDADPVVPLIAVDDLCRQGRVELAQDFEGALLPVALLPLEEIQSLGGRRV